MASGRGSNDKNVSQYAKDFHNSTTAFLRGKPEPAIAKPNFLDPQDTFDATRYQNACIYVTYQDLDKNTWLLVTLNAPRKLDRNAHQYIMTPGGRRDYEDGLFETALKEMGEEAGLKGKDVVDICPNAMISYAGHALFQGKRGGINTNSQLHIYHLNLGNLSPSEIEILHASIQGGDDVAIAEFINVQQILNDQVSKDFSFHLKGTSKPIRLHPEVIKTFRSINTADTAEYHRFNTAFLEQSMEIDDLADIYLIKFQEEQNLNKKLAIANYLILLTSCTNIETRCHNNKCDETLAKLKEIYVLSEAEVALALKKYNDKKGVFSRSTEKSKALIKKLNNCTSDSERFYTAQEYTKTEPNKDLASILREAISQKVLNVAITQDTVKADVEERVEPLLKFEAKSRYNEIIFAFFPLHFTQAVFNDKIPGLEALIARAEQNRSIDTYDYDAFNNLIGINFKQLLLDIRSTLPAYTVLRQFSQGDLTPSISIRTKNDEPINTNEVMILLAKHGYVPIDEYDKKLSAKP